MSRLQDWLFKVLKVHIHNKRILSVERRGNPDWHEWVVVWECDCGEGGFFVTTNRKEAERLRLQTKTPLSD